MSVLSEFECVNNLLLVGQYFWLIFLSSKASFFGHFHFLVHQVVCSPSPVLCASPAFVLVLSTQMLQNSSALCDFSNRNTGTEAFVFLHWRCPETHRSPLFFTSYTFIWALLERDSFPTWQELHSNAQLNWGLWNVNYQQNFPNTYVLASHALHSSDQPCPALLFLLKLLLTALWVFPSSFFSASIPPAATSLPLPIKHLQIAVLHSFLVCDISKPSLLFLCLFT